MKPSLYSIKFLTLFGYGSFLWAIVFFPPARCGSQEPDEKNEEVDIDEDKFLKHLMVRVEEGQEKLFPRPEFEKPIKELILETFKAHREKPNQLDFCKLFGFLDSKLTEDKKKLIKERGKIQLQTPLKEGEKGDGKFSNRGKKPITFEVVLKDKPVMVEIPTILKGHYFTSEKQCYYVFDPAYTIILYQSGFKWYKTVKVEKLLATEKLLFLDFEETEYDAGFSFGEEKKE